MGVVIEAKIYRNRNGEWEAIVERSLPGPPYELPKVVRAKLVGVLAGQMAADAEVALDEEEARLVQHG
jgi:hypothetical protein